MNELIKNIDKIHTTDMGINRIKKNIQVNVDDVICWCKDLIVKKDDMVERIGKNWYVTINNFKITINAQSYTIITVHKL